MTEETTPTAEASILGIAMHDPTVVDDAGLSEPDFQDARLGHLWDLMVRLRAESAPTDPATLVSRLGSLPVRIDPAMIADMFGAAPIAALADHYARLVAEKATLRRLEAAATKILQLARADTPADELVEIARAEVDATTSATARTHYVGDGLDATIESLSTAPTYTPTPWADLNHLIGGWRPGALYVIGARPGVGKTLLGLNAAVHLAERGHVAFNSLEMGEREVHERILASEAKVDMGNITRRRMTEADWNAIAAVRARLQSMPLSIDDRSSVTVTDIKSHARSVARRGNLVGIVVDYLQLMSTPRGDRRPRHEIVGEISRGLKILAKDLDVPIIALSQLNRASTQGDRRPTMADLRESGSLEQDSDVVMLLHVEEDDPSTMQVGVPKNRQGMTGAFELTRRGHFARLDGLAREELYQ